MKNLNKFELNIVSGGEEQPEVGYYCMVIRNTDSEVVGKILPVVNVDFDTQKQLFGNIISNWLVEKDCIANDNNGNCTHSLKCVLGFVE